MIDELAPASCSVKIKRMEGETRLPSILEPRLGFWNQAVSDGTICDPRRYGITGTTSEGGDCPAADLQSGDADGLIKGIGGKPANRTVDCDRRRGSKGVQRCMGGFAASITFVAEWDGRVWVEGVRGHDLDGSEEERDGVLFPGVPSHKCFPGASFRAISSQGQQN